MNWQLGGYSVSNKKIVTCQLKQTKSWHLENKLSSLFFHKDEHAEWIGGFFNTFLKTQFPNFFHFPFSTILLYLHINWSDPHIDVYKWNIWYWLSPSIVISPKITI